MKRIVKLFIALIMTLFIACTTKVNYEAEKENVRSTIQQHLYANKTEDVDLYISSWAEDDEMINFGMSGERWIGWKELRKHAIEAYELFDNIKFSTRELIINIYASGKIAWFSCYLDFSGTLNGKDVSKNGVRFTGVLEKQNNKWVYIQTHASIVPSLKGSGND